jgi:BirA family biotin operon repressor/biotin-[acetyl-CoA-carboxylase] ligase
MASAAAVAASRVPLDAAAFADMVGPGRALSRLEIVKASPSTNTALLEAVAAEPDDWPHLSALVADHQTAGRGRAGRAWATPPRAALTGSYVLRPESQGTPVPREEYGWAPLVVGLATVRALRRAGIGAFLKWPNDVVVEAGARDIPEWGRWRKCVGILCEAVPGQDAIVAGIGINVSQEPSELPVPHAASLATLGAASLDRTALLRSLAGELRDAVDGWAADAVAGEPGRIADAVAGACATLGWDIAVDVPGGAPVTGKAVRLSAQGGLVVATSAGEQTVLAGDVRVRRAG